VAKHFPGHGRAVVDSHQELPDVDADLDDLEHSELVSRATHHFIGSHRSTPARRESRPFSARPDARQRDRHIRASPGGLDQRRAA